MYSKEIASEMPPHKKEETLCNICKLKGLNLKACKNGALGNRCLDFIADDKITTASANDPVNSPGHYVGKIECIDYLRDKLTPAELTGFCMGNVLKYCSRWRKKDGVQDLHKAMVYLKWAIENEEKHA